MIPGQLVVVLGKIDNRIRDDGADGLVIGTVDEVYGDDIVVLLESGNIWRGSTREVALAKEQE